MMKLKTFFTAMMVFVIVCPAALAEDGTAAAKNWEWSLSPMYLWAASIDGDLTVKGFKVDVNESFSDIVENLDGAATFHFEGLYRQRWGFFTDLMYISLDPDDESTPLGDVSIDVEQTLAEFGGFHRWTIGKHAIDGLGGYRYTSLKGKLGTPAGFPNFDKRESWLDPFVGARWIWRMTDQWGLRLRGDIGGFSLGSDSSWNAIGLITFKPWKNVGFGGGYRALYQDFSSGSGSSKFRYDATMYGPILGLDITW